jgi:heme-degrading monooxygenase HmoA
MTIIQVEPEKIDDAVRIYRKSVVPEAKKQKGYRGACVLVDPKSGKCISVTFWRTEKDAIANEESLYYQEQLVKFLNLLAGPMIREGYEVRVHSMNPQAKPKPKKKPKSKPKKK